MSKDKDSIIQCLECFNNAILRSNATPCRAQGEGLSMLFRRNLNVNGK
jgi:hypothetical protein